MTVGLDHLPPTQSCRRDKFAASLYLCRFSSPKHTSLFPFDYSTCLLGKEARKKIVTFFNEVKFAFSSVARRKGHRVRKLSIPRLAFLFAIRCTVIFYAVREQR